MRKLAPCFAVCALALGCASPSTEITLFDSVDVAVHRGESGISLVEVRIGPSAACRKAKVSLAFRGHTPRAIVARAGAATCSPA